MKKHIITVSDEWFLENLTIFSDTKHCRVNKTVLEDDLFKDDATHINLIKKYKKASKELRDYEYNIRNNFKI